MSEDQPTIKGLELLRTIAANALDDDAYRQRLLDDPAGVLTEEGITVPDGVNVVVYQNTEEQIYLVLPTEQQEEDQLSPDETDIRWICKTVHF